MAKNDLLTSPIQAPKAQHQRFGWAIALSLASLLLVPSLAYGVPNFSETGRSGSRVGGASRSGGCATNPTPMTPLAPVSAGYGGRTTEARPMFWIYVPYNLTEESPVTFYIHDETGRDIYQKTFVTQASAGIYGITLPTTVELEPGKTYDWYFLVYCNDPLRQDVPSYASGWVERVSVNGMNQAALDALPPVERSRAYADELLWYDALSSLGEYQQERATSDSIQTAWTELLSLPSVQLNEFADQPVVPCCNMNQLPDIPQ